MSKKQSEPVTLTPDSTYSEVIVFDNARLKSLTKETVESSRKNFKQYDLDSDGFLDFHDVTKMMEKLGQTKTATEVRKLIAEVDKDNDGKVSFLEFLGMLAGNSGNKNDSGAEEQPLFGRIYEKGLGNKAKFFEQAAASTKDTTANNRDQIKKEYEQKKALETARKTEADKEQKEAAEKERLKQESRAKLAAKAAAFAK